MIQAESDTIKLDQNSIGTLLIRNVGDSCIFKVKANAQQAVEAKPTHGIMRRNAETIISVRYKGKITDLDKVKLKIFWLPIPSVEVDAGPVSQIYCKIKMQSHRSHQQQSLAITFAFKRHEDSQAVQEFRYQQQVGSRLFSQKGENKTIKAQSEVYKQQPSLSMKSAQKRPTHKTQRQAISKHPPILSIAFAIFLLGISFGIKITRLNILEASGWAIWE